MSLEFSATHQTLIKKGLGEALLQVKEGVAGGRHAVHTLFDLALKQDPEVFRVLQAFADDADARGAKGDAA
jgi:hypothetical protein